MRKKVKIDWEDLIVAFEGSGFDQSNYLDLETGEVVSVMRETMDSDEIDETERRVNSQPERYRFIPSIDSSEAYDDMVKFIDTVEDRHLAELLSVAICGNTAEGEEGSFAGREIDFGCIRLALRLQLKDRPCHIQEARTRAHTN